MEFTSDTQTATFDSPLEDFAETSVEIEIREDPLTGRQTRIVPDSFLEPESSPELPDSVTDDDGCFFCPDTVDSATPKYPDFVSFDRGAVGEATSFPNLNPYGAHSNVVVLTEDHYVPIDELSAAVLGDGLSAAVEYITAVFAEDPSVAVASVNMNLLPAAGSSIIHPHVQTLVDDRGTNSQQARIEGARAHLNRTGRNYFDDAVDASKSTDRYIGSTAGVDWIAPYAPRHHRHVRGIVSDGGPVESDSPVLESIATGLEHVLSQYAETGLNSFNFGFHLVEDAAVKPHIDVVARAAFEEYGWSDATFFETIHDESVIDVPPETYATSVAKFF